MHASSSTDFVMGNFIGLLMKARDTAHMWHWKVKSFALHMALGELYESLTEFMDVIMEMYMGKYGTEAHVPLSEPNPFDEIDPIAYINQLCQFLEGQHDVIPQDKWFVNKYEELQGAVAQIKYKMENLH